MKFLYSFILSLSSVYGFSQTILYQQETASRTVQDPQAVVLTTGFHASASSSNPFIAKIGPSTESSGGGPTDSNAGAGNPSGTTSPSGQSFHDTKGNLEVNGAGQLQFTLPIALPPSIKSVAPQVNLVYTSGSGNGIAGYGWNLSGITAISRMGKTIEKDGNPQGIQLDYSDYYSFNGQRLILKSGEYGKDGAEYVTENYSNIKIKSVGTGPASSPAHFEVTFEDGSQAWYGAYKPGFRNNSGVMETTPLEYNIVKWIDAQGNYITYNYTSGTNSNGFRSPPPRVRIISSIEWGGNETLNKPHFNSIQFNYIDRDLKEQSFVQNTEFKQDKILSEIKVNSNGKQFRKYTINYLKNGTNYQFVDKITEYNLNNEFANPVTFEYQKDDQVNGVFKQDSRYDDIASSKISGDFNGDGKLDFINGNTLMLGRLDGTGQFVNINYTGIPLSVGSYVKNNIVLDRQVLFTIEEVSTKKYKINTYQLDNGNNFSLIDSKLYDYSGFNVLNEDPNKRYDSLYNGLEADFNGDGSSDTVFSVLKTGCNRNSNQYCGILASGAVSELQSFYIDHLNHKIQLLDMPIIEKFNSRFDKIGDFNGNGKSNILQLYGNTIKIFELNNQEQFTEIFSTSLESMETMYLGDFNGDGKTDIISPIANDSSDWRMYISTGKGFNKYYYSNLFLYQPAPPTGPGRKFRNIARTYTTPDLNKDGKSDLMIFESQVWYRDAWDTWNNRDSSYGINYLRNEGVDNTGKPIFINNYSISPVELNIEGETLNFSMYGEHYSPIVGSFRVAQLNTELTILHKNTLTTWDFGNKLNVISKVKSITQGGLKNDVEYSKLINNGIIYKSLYDSNAITYPYANTIENLNYTVVSKLTQLDKRQEFRYRDLINNLHGKGTIGFRQTARSTFFANGFEGTKIWSGAEIDPLNNAVPIKEWSIKTNSESAIFPANISENNTQLLSFKSNQYRFDKLLNGNLVDINTVSSVNKSKLISATIPIKSITKDFMKNVRAESDIIYDTYYLPTKTTTNTNNGFAISSTEVTYTHNISGVGKDYYIGRPQSQLERMNVYGDSKKSLVSYIYENNLLKSNKTILGDNANNNFTEEYAYDGFGNAVQKKTTFGVDGNSSTEITQYDPTGRFITKKIDHIGLETNTEYNDYGQITKQISPLGITLVKEYDAWGKLLKLNNNIEGTTTYTYEKLIGNEDLKITEYHPAGDQKISYINILGQQYLSTVKKLGQGQYVSVKTSYDSLGRKTGESEPYSGQSPTQWNTIEFDDYSRTTKTISFNGKVTETLYNDSQRAVTTIEKNTGNGGSDRYKKQITDPLDNIISSEDSGGIITYKYDAAGQNTEANYQGNIVKTVYDIWGNKTRFEDPSNGVYEYEYSGYMGAISRIKSPKGEKRYEYNNKGQLIRQTERTNVENDTDKTINFTYNAKGLIIQKAGTSKGNAYTSNITYDPQGRILSSSESNNGKYFIQKGITYDDKARVVSYEKQLYSSGTLTKVQVENVYSTWNGELIQVRDKQTGRSLWQLDETNAKGQVLKAKLGASNITNTYAADGFLTGVNHSSSAKPSILQLSYSFDAIKNELKSRTTGGDFNIIESFDYDDNNRLVNWTNPVTGVKPSSKRNVYDVKGRILENDQVGSIKFQNNQKIYQPTSMVLNTAGTQNYNNDLIQSISYNENNDPVFIDGEKGDVAFQYGLTSMRQRVSYGGNFNVNGEGKFTKFYSEDGSFEVIKDNTTGREKHILYIGGTPYESNIVYLKDYTQSSGSFRFLHKDYIGSILAISDEAGNKLEQRHFDAWGNFTHLKIGNAATLTGAALNSQLSTMSLVVDRGYTSHEHFDEVGIIHMNGRLYDPLLRRFLNADENIQDPTNTQNYNKYGYVLNNPLMYNDPSGELIWWLPAAIAIVSNAVQSYIANQPMTFDGVAFSILMSYTSSIVSMGVGQVFQVASTALNLGSLGAKAMSVLANGVSNSIIPLMSGAKNIGKIFLTSVATSVVTTGIGLLSGSGEPSSDSGNGVSGVSVQGATDSYTADNTLTVTLPELILKNKATWQRDLMNHITREVPNYWSDYNLQQSRIRLGNAIASYKAAQQIEAFESFLFMELPMFFAGGELAVLGWRALGVGRFLAGSAGKLATEESANALVKVGTQWSKHSMERLAERGITKKMAEVAIKNGQKFYDPLNKSINYILPKGFASGKSLLVGTNPLTGEVTTVLRSSKNLIKPRMIPIQ